MGKGEEPLPPLLLAAPYGTGLSSHHQQLPYLEATVAGGGLVDAGQRLAFTLYSSYIV